MDAKARFMSYVSPESLTGCWLWTGAYGGNGYPSFSYKGKATKASRLSYLFFNEEINEGNCIRHICHNPSCVNPNHLLQGTQKDNMQDSVKSGRLNIKLTDEQVLNILKEYEPFVMSLKQLAKKYNVSKRNILDIVKGRKFQHLYEKHKTQNNT